MGNKLRQLLIDQQITKGIFTMKTAMNACESSSRSLVFWVKRQTVQTDNKVKINLSKIELHEFLRRTCS